MIAIYTEINYAERKNVNVSKKPCRKTNELKWPDIHHNKHISSSSVYKNKDMPIGWNKSMSVIGEKRGGDLIEQLVILHK